MPMLSEPNDMTELRNKIIGLGEKSIRKSYYPELQQRIDDLERANGDLVREMAERRASQESQFLAEQKFGMLFNAMTEMVAIHELVFDTEENAVDYRILQCNAAYSDVTGMRQEDVVGKLGSAVYGMSPPPYLTEFSNVALTGVPYLYNDYYEPMDKHFNISVVSPWKNCFATITTDVTDIQRIKEMVTIKNKELENYLYIASHDLRSPLVNIQGFSSRLKRQAGEIEKIFMEAENSGLSGCEKLSEIRTILSEGIPKTLNFIFTNVAKMDKLINGLLLISRTGRISMSVQRIDMNALLDSVLGALSFQLEQAKAEVRLSDLPHCYGDENLLNQLFTNIVGNAIKYRDENRPLVITIGCDRQSRRNVYSVRDTGVGIPERHRERIFDVFYRVDWNGPIAGDGIGLSIVKRIVDKHKGKIWVESEENLGTAFFIELPAESFRVSE